jgi:hypothetical protein
MVRETVGAEHIERYVRCTVSVCEHEATHVIVAIDPDDDSERTSLPYCARCSKAIMSVIGMSQEFIKTGVDPMTARTWAVDHVEADMAGRSN